VTFLDDNNIEIPFSDPVSGRAVLLAQGGAASSTQVVVPKIEELRAEIQQEMLGGMKSQTTTRTNGNLRIKLFN